MGIELPAELADIAARTGAKWPEADEDAMRAQAQSWRAAAGKVDKLAADADGSAGGALAAMRGEAGESANSMWKRFIDPGKGTLTSASRRANKAADRLEHAAGQIADAKVEMVRQLTDAAKNVDAANAAGGGGHPTALLGVDSLLGGVATNLASVTDSLVGAVGDTAQTLSTGEVVNTNPGASGAHGQRGLLGAVTGLPGDVVSAATGTTSGVLDAAGGAADGALRGTGGVAEAAGGAADGALRGAGGVADAAARAADGALDAGSRAAEGTLHAADGAAREARDVVDTGEREVGNAAEHAGRGVRDLADVSPTAPTPPSGIGVMPSGGGSFADAPTPPSGFPQPTGSPAGIPHIPGGTTAAGLAEAPAAPPPVPPSMAPGAGPAPAAPVGGGAFAPPPMGGVPGAPPVPGAPAPGAHGAPGAAGGAGGAAQHGPAAGAGHAQQRPDRAPIRNIGAYPDAGAPPGRDPRHLPPMHQHRPPVHAFAPAPQHPYGPYQQQPPPPQVAPGYGTPRTDRASVVALFLAHMFPIGHLPVPVGAPSLQLPPPNEDDDFAPGLRFEPHDHPESGLIELEPALRRALDEPERTQSSAGLPSDHPAVAGLLDRYDPQAGMSEHDWDRRYLVRAGSAGASEYAWPPGELYPEGGQEPGEGVMIEEGTVLDRFGTPDGRVFARDAESFAARALPPEHAEAGYRRYRVLRELPMWQAISAGWFGQPGGGVRYRAVYSAEELVALGYLAELASPEAEPTAPNADSATPEAAPTQTPPGKPASDDTGEKA